MTYFRHVYFPNIKPLIKKDINGKRHYYDPTGSVLQKGVFLPSVTNVTGMLSEVGIRAWKARIGEVEAKKVQNNALKNGTELHLIIENFLNNKATESFKNPVSLELFRQMKPELLKINNIRAQEVPLYSTNLGLAGTVDCIAEYNGKLSVIDFKSATKKKQKSWIKGYFLQATAYSLMCKELTGGKIDPEQIAILISARDGTVESFIENRDDYIEPLKQLINDWKEKYVR